MISIGNCVLTPSANIFYIRVVHNKANWTFQILGFSRFWIDLDGSVETFESIFKTTPLYENSAFPEGAILKIKLGGFVVGFGQG